MRKLLSLLIDCIFPPSYEEKIVRALTDEEVLLLYTYTPLEGTSALTSFKDKRVRALIHEAKFHGNTRAFDLLGLLVGRYVETCGKSFDYIVPVPLHPRRLRERGYNQVSAVLHAHTLTIPILENALVRSRHTSPQTKLARDTRLLNLKDAFWVKEPEMLYGKRILLVDDVTTTGATLDSAQNALMVGNPTSITCVALAH